MHHLFHGAGSDFTMLEYCRAGKAEGEARALQKAVGELTEHKKVSLKELDVLTELNRGLISNQQTFKDMVAALRTEVNEKDATIMVWPLHRPHYWHEGQLALIAPELFPMAHGCGNDRHHKRCFQSHRVSWHPAY